MRKCLLVFGLLSTLFVKAQDDGRPVKDSDDWEPQGKTKKEAPAPKILYTAEGEPYFEPREYPDKNVIIVQQGANNKIFALLQYSSKKKLTPFVYDEIDGFFLTDTTAVVKSNSKYGIINARGELIIPCMYDVVSKFTLDSVTYFLASKDSRFGIINIKNETVIPFQYDFITTESKSNIFKIQQNGKYGYMQFPSCKVVVPVIYDRIRVLPPDGLLLVKKDSLYTILNKNGEKIFRNWYSQLEIFNYEKSALVKLNGRKGVIDLTEKEVIPLKYDVLNNIDGWSKISYMAARGGKYGIIDIEGKVVAPFEYDLITRSNTDFLIASKNKKKGLLNKDGSVVLPFEYDELSENGHYFTLTKNNKVGIADLKAKIIVPLEYGYLRPFTIERSFRHTSLIGTKNGKKGVVKFDGKPQIDFIYDDLISFEKFAFISTPEESFINPVIAIKGGKYGVIDIYGGSEVLPFIYEDLQYVNKYLVTARMNKKYGIVDISNKDNIVLPFEYKLISNKNNIITAYKEEGVEKYRASGRILKNSN